MCLRKLMVSFLCYMVAIIFSEKQLKTLNSFDFITFEKIISKQCIFVFNRPTNLQFIKMQIKIYGSLVTIQ